MLTNVHMQLICSFFFLQFTFEMNLIPLSLVLSIHCEQHLKYSNHSMLVFRYLLMWYLVQGCADQSHLREFIQVDISDPDLLLLGYSVASSQFLFLLKLFYQAFQIFSCPMCSSVLIGTVLVCTYRIFWLSPRY